MITEEMVEAARAEMRPFVPPNDETLSKAITAAFAAMPSPAVKVEYALQAAADANGGYINGKMKNIVIAALNAFSAPNHEASKHAVALRQCAIFAADVGVNIVKAMTDAADFLSALTPAPDLSSENERLRKALEFVTLWAWREDPPNANRKLTDEERLSAIKYHPSIRPSRAALERT